MKTKTNKKFFVNNVRLELQAKEILEAAANLPLKKALEMIGTLVGKSVREIYSVKRYSPQTGEPVEYEWRPSEIWDGKLGIGGHHRVALGEDDLLYQEIKRKFPAGETTVVDGIVVTHYPGRDDGVGYTAPYLSFKKAKKLD